MCQPNMKIVIEVMNVWISEHLVRKTVNFRKPASSVSSGVTAIKLNRNLDQCRIVLFANPLA